MTADAATPHNILHPATWPQPRGYANGIEAQGRLVFVGGQIGWNSQQELAPDFLGQARLAMENVVAVLAEAQATPEHLVRLTWYVTDIAAYEANQRDLGGLYREILGRHFPAMTLVQVVRLAEPDALIEVEATAVVP